MSGPPACPICGAPRQPRYRPFCSRRCADIDLNRWLSGSYSLAGESDDEPDERGPRRSGGETPGDPDLRIRVEGGRVRGENLPDDSAPRAGAARPTPARPRRPNRSRPQARRVRWRTPTAPRARGIATSREIEAESLDKRRSRR